MYDRILYLDLAFKRIGATIFIDDKLVDYRCIFICKDRPSKKIMVTNPKVVFLYTGGKSGRITIDDWHNMLAVARIIKNLIKFHDINYIVFEIPTGMQAARPNKLLGVAQGIAAGIIADEFEYCYITPSEVKMAACGRSKGVSKDQVIDAMKRLYPSLAWMPTAKKYNEHIYDSFAVREAYQKVKHIRGSQIDKIT